MKFQMKKLLFLNISLGKFTKNAYYYIEFINDSLIILKSISVNFTSNFNNFREDIS